MNEIFHNSIREAASEHMLTAVERARMRGALVEYMAMKPLRGLRPAPARSVVFWMRPVAAVLVLALFVSTAGVSYAAEGALPGDLLYPIKVHVNEPVTGAIALSSTAKAAWAASVAGERVKEAATLAAEGRLSTTTQQELQSSFDSHAQLAINEIAGSASTSPDGSAESAVRFEAQLSEYQRVLGQIAIATHVDVADIASAVSEKRVAVAAVRASAETDLREATSSDGGKAALATARIRDAAKRQYDDSSKLARDTSAALEKSSAEGVAVQLQQASDTISSGDRLLAEHSNDAIDQFQNALAASEQIGVFLRTSSAIHARTGMVIAQPSSVVATAHTEGQGGVVPTTAPIHAAALMHVEANETGGVAAATTSATSSASTTDSVSSGEHTPGAESENDSTRRHSLQISIPTFLDN